MPNTTEAPKAADSQVLNLWAQYRAMKDAGDRLLAEEADDDKISDAYGAMHSVADEIGALIPASVLALGAHLIHEINAADNDVQVLRAHRASLAAIRTQLVGDIAEAADRILGRPVNWI